MKPIIKAVIFDIDGLLLDTEPLWDQTDNILLRKKGFTLSKELLIKRVGTGQRNGIELFKKEFGIDEDTDAMVQERINIFNSLLDENLKLMDGTEELVMKLHKNNILMAIATGGHTVKSLKKLLKRFKILQYFPVIVGRENIKNGKPSPDIFLHAAKKLNVNPPECLVLEDAPSGVETGKKAGMYTFGVNKIPEIQKRLRDLGADKVFSSLKQIKITDILS